MRSGTPFRAAALLSMALAAIAQQFAAGSVVFQQHASSIGPYKGRGKGRARRHDNGGTRRAQRAAVKTRNIKRFRAQSKG